MMSLGIHFVSALCRRVERTMVSTLHIVELDSLPQLVKALKAFDICVSSLASSLWLLATGEPRYLNLFTWVSTWPFTGKMS